MRWPPKRRWTAKRLRQKRAKPRKDSVPKVERVWTKQQAAAFYESYEWADARYKAFLASDGRCVVCGKDRNDKHEDGAPVKMRVDHIKPLRVRPDLRSDPDNLQVFCDRCNKGKGDWDETDWR